MAEQLISAGFFIILLGIVILLIGIFSSAKSRSKVEGGAIVFIGPFPLFGGATSKEVFYILLIVSLILTIIFLLFREKI